MQAMRSPSGLSLGRFEEPEDLREQLLGLYRVAARDLNRASRDSELSGFAMQLRELCLRIEEMQSLLDDEEEAPELDTIDLSLGVAGLAQEVGRVRTALAERMAELERGQ